MTNPNPKVKLYGPVFTQYSDSCAKCRKDDKVCRFCGYCQECCRKSTDYYAKCTLYGSHYREGFVAGSKWKGTVPQEYEDTIEALKAENERLVKEQAIDADLNAEWAVEVCHHLDEINDQKNVIEGLQMLILSLRQKIGDLEVKLESNLGVK